MKLRIKSMICNREAKNNQPEQQEEKRIEKNEDSINSPWDNLRGATFT